MDALQPKLPADMRIFPLSDSYPAGDEFVMVNDITKRVIPPGGLPKDVGAVVMNVETLMNIGDRQAGDPQVPDGRRRGGRPRHAFRADRHYDRRSDRSRGRRDCPGFWRAPRRRDDGQSRAEPGSAGHENARRHHRAACRSQPDQALPDAVGAKSIRSANPPATSAASAPTSARAICWAIRSSRTPRCAR